MTKHELEYSRHYREKNREKNRAASLAWRHRNREQANATRRAYGQREEVKARVKALQSTTEEKKKQAERMRRYRSAHHDHLETVRRTRYLELRLAVIEAYGGQCACCGERHPHFLSFDHIDNDGAQARRMDKSQVGRNLYPWLLKAHRNNIQLLCYNCNFAKGHYGICPHKENST